MEILNEIEEICLDFDIYRKDIVPSGSLYLGSRLYEDLDIIGFTSNLDSLIDYSTDNSKIICIPSGTVIRALISDELFFVQLDNKHLEVVGLMGDFITCVVK